MAVLPEVAVYWEKDVETMERGALEALQLERLRDTVRHAVIRLE